MEVDEGISQRTYIYMTHRHRQQWGDGEKGEMGNGDICNVVNNKNKVNKVSCLI